MVTSRFELLNRKLSAIVYADVHGYSRLMDQDEAGTVVRLTQSLSFIRGLVGDPEQGEDGDVPAAEVPRHAIERRSAKHDDSGDQERVGGRGRGVAHGHPAG